MKSKVSATFYLSAALGGTVGMVGALAMSGLSAFAMKRLGVEMQWLMVAASGAAGGVVGNLILKLIVRILQGRGLLKKSLDRFVALFVSGFLLSLVLGGVVLSFVFQGQQGAVGPRLFTVIGWMVGLLASSFPLALVALNESETS